MANTPYATDEDLALRASADFAILCPRDQKLAYGVDGYFDPSDRWTLRSASVNFSAQGVVPGQVVQLLGPVSLVRSPGESLVVVATGANSVTLRRRGQAAGMGQPPGPAGGALGVEFLIATLSPQIERASFEIDRRFGISDDGTGRDASDLRDPRELREIVVLTVLQGQYLDMSREVSGPHQDALAAKARVVKDELDELLARAAVHWRSDVGGFGDAATTRFSTRITR